jgi:hypothetical protein
MSVNGLWGIVRDVGGISGLLSLSAIVWGWFINGRPLATIRVGTSKDDAGQIYLDVRNTREPDIWLKRVEAFPPPLKFDDYEDDRMLFWAATRDVFPSATRMVIRRGDRVSLMLNHVEKIEGDKGVRFKVHWRDLSRPRLWQMPVTLRTSTSIIREIVEGA